MRLRVFLVEPNVGKLLTLLRALEPVAEVQGSGQFATARRQLIAAPPDVVITNIRLAAYNGLHLVHLVRRPTKAIVYMDPPDALLLQEAQRAGAFVGSYSSLTAALTPFVQADLPPRDRRSVLVGDRRHSPRGGRRAVDAFLLGPSPSNFKH